MKQKIIDSIDAQLIKDLNSPEYLEWTDGSEITLQDLQTNFYLQIDDKGHFNLRHKEVDFYVNDIIFEPIKSVINHLQEVLTPDAIQDKNGKVIEIKTLVFGKGSLEYAENLLAEYDYVLPVWTSVATQGKIKVELYYGKKPVEKSTDRLEDIYHEFNESADACAYRKIDEN